MQLVLPRFFNVTSITDRFSLLSLRFRQQQKAGFLGNWIMNRSGHMSFRARVVQADHGWRYWVESRTGWQGAAYEYDFHIPREDVLLCRNQAIAASCLLAKQLATMRYRFQ
ncbi:hypothetical protein F6X34_20005 [Dickeya dianthicola]|uniref:hypothetical protein n=1 Tax=Dickeya dianthicola TaxID=204039 RepID=UPI00136969C5|nr:hypothetical protein [Dickeya dianthicola]MZG45128.1 hypothetical protein [Dickeya dianthicola]